MKKFSKKIHVIGLNSFEFRDLSPSIQELFRITKNIAVPKTFSAEIKDWESKSYIQNKIFFESESNINLINWLKSINDDVILVSRGDPLWYGIGRILLKSFSQKDLTFYPANTCIQLAFSKLKKSWQGNKAISIHGRDSVELIKLLKSKEKSISILTDPKINSLKLIRDNIKELNLNDFYDFWLFEDLGFEKERIRLISINEEFPKRISDLNIVILLKKEIISSKISFPLFGINDSEYNTFDDRPNLITKRDIRIQILADLELPNTGTLFDIGSGCGTIGLEALRIRPKIKLVCIDKRFGSKELIKSNADMLGVNPNEIFEGDVRKYLKNISQKIISESNRIIIGGCDLETKIFIIEVLTKLLKKDDVIVIPIITFEILQQISTTLIKLDYLTKINLIQISKGISIADGTRFEPNNPVFIIKAKKN